MKEEAKVWLSKIFLSNDQSLPKLLALVSEMLEAPELTGPPEFLYELAKYNSDAAFLFWQMRFQKKLKQWILKYSKGESFAHIVSTQLFPIFTEQDELLILHKGKAYKESISKKIIRPLAFRTFEWREVNLESLSLPQFSYDEDELHKLLKEELPSCSVIVAGIKNKSYQLAYTYTNERVQGGRLIKDWSLVQTLLSEIFLNVKEDEILIKNNSIESAFSILKNADQFASLNLQIFGGAGYTEDYIVERLFRECQFLKNWPRPFKLSLLNHYQQEVLLQ